LALPAVANRDGCRGGSPGADPHPPMKTMNLPAYLTPHENGVCLAIKLQPRAAKDEIARVEGNELKIKVTAPPVDAAANEALLRLLAETLDCPRSAVQLVRGHTARHKVVVVRGVSPEAAVARLPAGL
jgi:hypothetical protein